VSTDTFSARWRGNFSFESASYKFTYSSDDGIRIWLDGTQIVNDWAIHGASTKTVTVAVGAGTHQVKIEYFEQDGAASAAVSWAKVVATGQIWLPFERGSTWWVCQGYKGSPGFTHSGIYAFDLTKTGPAQGPNACLGDADASSNFAVIAPATGTSTRLSVSGNEFVCLSIDASHSILIGHLKPRSRIANGPVTGGVTVIGTVRPPVTGTNQGQYAHIHIEARASANCAAGTSRPFTAAYGFAFKGVGDLPDIGGYNQYGGNPAKALTRS
jgi:hypothetical protein